MTHHHLKTAVGRRSC